MLYQHIPAILLDVSYERKYCYWYLVLDLGNLQR